MEQMIKELLTELPEGWTEESWLALAANTRILNETN